MPPVLSAKPTGSYGIPGPSRAGRADRARARVDQALRVFEHCNLCAHRCGVDRIAGGRGPCGAGSSARVFLAQTEMVDEASLRPVFAVSLSGCDLRCDFCITGRSSWDPAAGTVVSGPGVDSEPLDGLAAAARRALGSGARSIMILGGEPTLHLPTVLDLISRLPDDALLVWKTNAHGTATARELLEGLFDVWVADYKFGQDSCAERLARVPNYTEVVRENLCWASRHTRLIVRHLLMPGHLDCCWVPVARWLAEELPGVEISLRDGFWPGWFSSRHPELTIPGSARDHAKARRIGVDLGLNLVD